MLAKIIQLAIFAFESWKEENMQMVNAEVQEWGQSPNGTDGLVHIEYMQKGDYSQSDECPLYIKVKMTSNEVSAEIV